MDDQWHTRIALAVIEQAIADCCVAQRRIVTGTERIQKTWVDDGRKRNMHADSARVFLSHPNHDLAFWCSVAGISQPLIIQQYGSRRCQNSRTA